MRREKRAFWAAALTVLLLTAEGCAPEPDVPPQPEEPPAVPAAGTVLVFSDYDGEPLPNN